MSIENVQSDTAIAVSVITGFLGSGKTTLLNYLLQHPDIDETAVLINEFGEIGLDHLLVEELDDEVLLLSSGCICCTVQGELVDSLKGLYLKRLAGQLPPFKRVVIETTGLADPIPIITCLMQDPLFKHVYRLESLVTTVDAIYGSSQLDTHPEAVRQAAVSDKIVITKTDLADPSTVTALRKRLNSFNPGAWVTTAINGEVTPNELFDSVNYDPKSKTLDVQRWLNEEAYTPSDVHKHEHSDHGHGHDHPIDVNRHDENIVSFCIYIDYPVAWHTFLNWFEDLANEKGERLLRVKGLVNIIGEDNPYVIHCVQATRHTPFMLPAWPDDDRRSRIVFITHKLSKEEVMGSLDALVTLKDARSEASPLQIKSGNNAARPLQERWLNDGEVTRIFGALSEHALRPAASALRLMLLTGTRVEDVRQATWDQFDLTDGFWRKPSSNSTRGQKRRVRLSEPVLALLNGLQGDRSGESWLFPNAGCDGPVEDIDHLWEEVTQTAGVEDAGLARLRPTLTTHLFAKQDMSVIRKLLGLSKE